MESKSREKWERLGYELVSQVPGRVQTTFTFRKLKTKTSKWVWIALGSGIVVLFIFIGIMASIENGADETASPGVSPSASAAAPSATPITVPTAETTPEPAPSELAPVVEPISDAEVLAFFNAYYDERKAAGVVFAQAITDVTFSNRVLRVIFDASVVGMDWETFDEVTPFAANYADFAVTPIAFNMGISPNVRASMDAVETFQADGTPRGTLTTAQVVEMNELD